MTTISTSSGDAPLAQRIYDAAHLTGEFVLRSGQVTGEYFDKYLFESDPALLRDIARALVDLVPPDTDALAGLELGGVPIATLLSQFTGLPLLFVRKQAKTYGTCRQAEGGEVSGRRLTIVEDVVTSGGAILDAHAHLVEHDAAVRTAVCVIDREAGATERLAAAGIELRPAFLMSAMRDGRSASRPTG